jgi:hypothetical protein
LLGFFIFQPSVFYKTFHKWNACLPWTPLEFLGLLVARPRAHLHRKKAVTARADRRSLYWRQWTELARHEEPLAGLGDARRAPPAVPWARD